MGRLSDRTSFSKEFGLWYLFFHSLHIKYFQSIIGGKDLHQSQLCSMIHSRDVLIWQQRALESSLGLWFQSPLGWNQLMPVMQTFPLK